MITDLNKILVEWAYRTSDGKPDVKNSAKLIVLETVLNDFGWSRQARAELLSTLMGEGDEWWTKLSPEQQAAYIKNHPKSQKAQDAKKKEKEDDEDPSIDTKVAIEKLNDNIEFTRTCIIKTGFNNIARSFIRF